jgi:hypothetical protein
MSKKNSKHPWSVEYNSDLLKQPRWQLEQKFQNSHKYEVCRKIRLLELSLYCTNHSDPGCPCLAAGSPKELGRILVNVCTTKSYYFMIEP